MNSLESSNREEIQCIFPTVTGGNLKVYISSGTGSYNQAFLTIEILKFQSFFDNSLQFDGRGSQIHPERNPSMLETSNMMTTKTDKVVIVKAEAIFYSKILEMISLIKEGILFQGFLYPLRFTVVGHFFSI